MTLRFVVGIGRLFSVLDSRCPATRSSVNRQRSPLVFPSDGNVIPTSTVEKIYIVKTLERSHQSVWISIPVCLLSKKKAVPRELL